MSATQHQRTVPNRSARKRGLTLLIAALVASFGALFMTAGPAAAADYGLNMDQACKYTYNNPIAEAAPINTGPFGWVCKYNSFSTSGIGPVILGGVDMQKYCSITYPGSRAIILNWNLWGWRCRR